MDLPPAAASTTTTTSAPLPFPQPTPSTATTTSSGGSTTTLPAPLPGFIAGGAQISHGNAGPSSSTSLVAAAATITGRQSQSRSSLSTAPGIATGGIGVGGAGGGGEKCPHKDRTGCSLQEGDCCSCADTRPHEALYERYIDGVGRVVDAQRWAHYCSFCKDHWDALQSRVPPRRNPLVPAITAWQLFHQPATPTPTLRFDSHLSLTLSTTAQHTLTPAAQAAILNLDDNFPPTFAVFTLMSPNYATDYHPVVATHIRTWGELEQQLAECPRFSPEFAGLLGSYYNARYKARRMTELDRQSRGVGGLSAGGSDEYFQLLSTPGPYDVVSTSGGGTERAGGGATGGGNTGRSGSISTGSGSVGRNLGAVGAGISRIVNVGNFLQSASASASNPNALPRGMEVGVYSTAPTRGSLPPQRTILPQLSTNIAPSQNMAGSPMQQSPMTSASFRFNSNTNTPTSTTAPPGRRQSMANERDRDRDRERDRDTGRSVAGTSSTATATAAVAAAAPAVASATSSSENMMASPHSPIFAPPESPSEQLYISSSSHSLNRSLPSSLLRPQRSRTLAAVTPEIETLRAAIDRRRQVRERVEHEWENSPNRPASSGSVNTTTTSQNRTSMTSIDSTVIDALMVDVPLGSEEGENNNGGGGRTNGNEGAGAGEMAASPARARGFFLSSPVREPWSSQLVAEANSGQPSTETTGGGPGPGPAGPVSGNGDNDQPGGSSAPPPLPASITSGFSFASAPNIRRSSMRQPHDLNPGILPPQQQQQQQQPSASTNETIMLPRGVNVNPIPPTNRISAASANFLPSLPHLPAPRFSPPRTLSRQRNGSISNSNGPSHRRNNSSGSDGIQAPNNTRRRERLNPLAQALGTRADVEREDYVSPIRTLFTTNAPTNPFDIENFHQQPPHHPHHHQPPPPQQQQQQQHHRTEPTEPSRRRTRDMDTDFLHHQPPSQSASSSSAAATNEANMRRIQDRYTREAERRQRVLLQRQIDQLHAQISAPPPHAHAHPHHQSHGINLPSGATNIASGGIGIAGMSINHAHPHRHSFPHQHIGHHGHSSHSHSRAAVAAAAAAAAAMDEPSMIPYHWGAEHDDDGSSNSDADYDDILSLGTDGLDNETFIGIVDGYLGSGNSGSGRTAHESVTGSGGGGVGPTRHRSSRLRRPFFNAGPEGILPSATAGTPRVRGSSGAGDGDNNPSSVAERLHTRIEQTRRLQQRTEALRLRHNEALRDIAGLVDGVRSAAMNMPRWREFRDSGSGGSSSGGSGSGSGGRAGTSAAPQRSLDHSERPPDNLKEEELKIMADCKVCYGQIADVVLLPCAHLVLCQWCAETVAPSVPSRGENAVAPRSNCPVCRARVDKKVKVFRC